MNQIEINLAVLLRARYPYIYINTFEEMRVLKSINIINREYNWKSGNEIKYLQRTIYTWSLTGGMVNITGRKRSSSGFPSHDSKVELMNLLDNIVSCEENAIFILKDFHIFLRDTRYCYEVVRKMRDILTHLRTSQFSKSVIIVSPVLVVPEEMQREITVFDYPLPNENEIFSIFNSVISENHVVRDIKDSDLKELAHSALGMTALEAENAFCRAIVQHGRASMEIFHTIYEEKRQCIRKNGLLDYIESDVKISDIGGLDVLKLWLQKRNNSWSCDAEEYCLPAPKGVLITGVPGCGKSLIAKTMSSAWGLPLVQLDMGRIYSGLVGSSEENMRRAIQTAEAMAPCVLWLDEIEKGLAGTGSSNDSGTSSRVFGTLLTWMQEKKVTVFILATSNDISGLRPELLRKGRFDEIFFVDLPTRMERREILQLHIHKRMCSAFSKMNFDDAFYEKMVDMTEEFNGAELEAIVVSALFEAYAGKRKVVPTDFFHAIENTVPLSRTQGEQIKALREWAIDRAVSATSSHYHDGEQNQGIGRILSL